METSKLFEGIINYPSAQENLLNFINNKLQPFLDHECSGMGLEVVVHDMTVGGAKITIEQRDPETGKPPLDGIMSWLNTEDCMKYCDDHSSDSDFKGEELPF